MKHTRHAGQRADVCLITPVDRANAAAMPFGLLYIGSYLEKHGAMTVRIIDEKFRGSRLRPVSKEAKSRLEKAVIENVVRTDPFLIGITCLVTETKEVLALSSKIKALLPHAVIVVGGVHPTMFPQDLLFAGSPVDYAVIGEGEITFTELAKALRRGAGARDVAGIAWYDGQEVIRTACRPLITDLDDIPPPLYHQLNTDYYFRPSVNTIRNMYLSTARVFTSRGCPVQCTFCVNKNLQKIMGPGKLFRQRSVKSVVDEIESLKRDYAIDGVYVFDDLFCLRKKFTLDFCRELKERDLGLVWATETRVNLVSRETLRAMADSGCVQIDFGVESGSQQRLDAMRKGITVEQIRRAFKLCHEAGIRPMANLMINTPGETEEDVENTLALAKEIDACYYGFGILVPFPGADIYERVQPKLTVDEYHLLHNAYNTLADPRFKFAAHDLDLEAVAWKAHLALNPIRKRLAFLLMWKYLRQVLGSGRKRDYAAALLELFHKFLDYAWFHLGSAARAALARPQRERRVPS